MAGELNSILTGEERRYPWKYGDMFYEVKGERGAKPLLLIHSFAPGASSHEWRKNIDALARQFRVYCHRSARLRSLGQASHRLYP